MVDYIYDIETYPNVFTIVIGNADTRKCWSFEISERKDQRQKLFKMLQFLALNKHRMVGFNNIGFDYPVLHFLMSNKEASVVEIYDYAMSIIKTQNDDDKFANVISWDRQIVKQIDLYKIHHFDNKARATSLKMIEFNMRSDDIEDLPFPVGSVLNNEQIDVLLKYNKHDMLQTYLFYKESLDAIRFREKLSKKYGKNFLNHNDTKIGKDYFIMKLEEAMPESCYKKQGRHRKIQQTKRKKINLGEVIFPYIKFDRPEFKAVLEWFRNKTITETKGVLTDIPEHELGEELAKYCEMVVKRKKLPEEPTKAEIKEMQKEMPKLWVEPKELKSGKVSWYKCWRIASNLNVVIDGFRYDFGVGGIHGSVESTVLRSTEHTTIIDQDVASYYPNLAIVNRVYPEHLGENFCDIYQDVYLERKSYPKGTPENAVMKLALNGVYGASNDKFSPFLDPKFTMAITINGQLSLCMLAEELLKIEGLKMVQVNTDGLTTECPNDKIEEQERICSEWEKVTKLELERNDYDLMPIRDVNNYLAVFTDGGKVKRNGAYQYEGLGWHQNQSALVVKMAAEHAIVHGGDIETFIVNHKDRMDFMLRTKVPRSSRLTLRYYDEDGEITREEAQQNITRYYIANDGGKLIKVMPPLPSKPENGEREIGINKEWLVKTCNRIKDYDGDINYDYYIKEAEKLVKPLLEKS